MSPIDESSTKPSDALVPMSTQELQELPDADLIARSMAVAVRRMHDDGSSARRAAVIRELTNGQRAVLAFWIFYSHARGGLSSFSAVAPHRLVHAGFWMLVEAGLERVGDSELLALVRRLRAEVARTLAESGYPAGLGADGELQSDDFSRLAEALGLLEPQMMQMLDDQYRRLAPLSVHRMAQHIRENPDQFIASPPQPAPASVSPVS